MSMSKLNAVCCLSSILFGVWYLRFVPCNHCLFVQNRRNFVEKSVSYDSSIATVVYFYFVNSCEIICVGIKISNMNSWNKLCRACLTTEESFTYFIPQNVSPETYLFCTSIEVNK